MDNFGCQQLGYPDTWSNIILVVSMRVILDEINTWISILIKQFTLPYMCVCVCVCVCVCMRVKGAHLINWRHNGWERGNSACLTVELGHWSSAFRLELHHQLSCLSGVKTQMEILPLPPLGLKPLDLNWDLKHELVWVSSDLDHWVSWACRLLTANLGISEHS